MNLVAVIVLGLCARQSEKVTLTWAPKQGDKFKTTQSMTMKVKANVVAGEQKQSFEVENRQIEVRTHEMLEVVDGKPKSVVFDTEKSVEEQKPPGADEFQTKEKPLHKTRITVTEKNGKLSYEGGEGVDPKDLKKLDLEADKFSQTFPGKPIAVGESWEVAGEKARALFGKDDNDFKDGKVSCTLKEIKEIDGRKCVVVDMDLDLTGKSAEGVEISMSTSGQVIVLLDRGYAISVKLKGKVTMSTENDQMTMHGEGPISIEVSGSLK